MPQAKRRAVHEIDPASDAAPKTRSPRGASAQRGDGGVSPALALQGRLASQLAAQRSDDDGKRWSPRASLGLAGGASVLIWGAIALAISALR
jgi:hypothetical protein